MTVELGPMGLLATEPNDVIEDYVNGLQPDGGEWTNWTRLSAHDHSGGQMGSPVAVTIPPGSITTEQLDPSVLGPYALTDGSKPFTGQVTMQADAIVRDALYFGEQGNTNPPDATLQRIAAGDLALGDKGRLWLRGADATNGNRAILSSTPAGLLRWSLDMGNGDTLTGGNAGARFVLSRWADDGSYLGNPLLIDRATGTLFLTPDANGTALDANGHIWAHGPGAELALFDQVAGSASYAWRLFRSGNTFSVHQDAVGIRAQWSNTGTLTLTPDVGASALLWASAGGYTHGITPSQGADPAFNYSLGGYGPYLWQNHITLRPHLDNVYTLGDPSHRFNIVYAASGVNTSSRDAKADIAPLDPAAAMAAVRATEPVTFTYKAPERGPEQYELSDDPEQAEQQLLLWLTNAPLEAAARHQAGFVTEQAADLFVCGEGQSSPSNSVGVLLAALHDVDRRLSALEEGTPA